MSTLLIACSMMEDEIALVMKKTGNRPPVEWLDRRLHLVPEKLRGEIQKTIAQHPASGTILLGMAQCGNALVGVQSRHATLVLPRFSDCPHLLRSTAEGDKGELDARALYLTRGWLEGEGATLAEYGQLAARRGEETARRAYRAMMAEYRRVCMIETGAFDMDEAAVRGRQTAELLGLDYGTVAGTTRVLEKLLAGRWDDEFITVPPGGQIGEEDFC